MTTLRMKVLTMTAALALLVLMEAIPAEARHGGGRGGFRGGSAGPRIGFVAPRGFYGGYHGGFYNHYYGPYGYHYGPYRGREGGLNPVQARLMGWGAIDLNVKPGKAEVWVGGKYLGTARDFDGIPTYLWLEQGEHEVTIYRGGFETFSEHISITPGEVIKLKLKLEPGESQPPEAAAKAQGPDPKA